MVVSGRDTQRGAEVVAEIRANGGRADFVAADPDGSAAASRALADEARSVLGGRVDILVNNAGIFPANGTLDNEATFDRVLAVNVKAAFFLTAALVPHMTESGGGAVINLGSWAVRQDLPQGIACTASKGALEALTRAWSAEFGSRGVRVNAISPGVVLTPDPDETTPNPVRVMMKGTPHGTTGTPEAIGRAAVYLASDESSFVHGTVLDVDGGRTAVAVIAG
ncbi:MULTISPECIES: SDR family NAD(P)-dependent oxidoreductase [Streptomyces]|uniref:Dehydrogenase n=1 Tax=Streptomyces canarius TaxID=285453 RepID=A0ABQ3D8K4_9ACTN|nr:SDR family oxidoreductase [Streptomyces canarius]GHA63801.1 dehydrogenase [Streptomyces canarius]